MSLFIALSDEAQPAVREAIGSRLAAYNTSKAGDNHSRPLVLTIQDGSAQILGGLWGRTGYGWLFVELLYVPDALRGKGCGTELMTRAEAEAVSRGCHSSWLDTFEFQARGFYERLGYGCFGELSDYPTGFSRYFMRKRIGGDAA